MQELSGTTDSLHKRPPTLTRRSNGYYNSGLRNTTSRPHRPGKTGQSGRARRIAPGRLAGRNAGAGANLHPHHRTGQRPEIPGGLRRPADHCLRRRRSLRRHLRAGGRWTAIRHARPDAVDANRATVPASRLQEIRPAAHRKGPLCSLPRRLSGQPDFLLRQNAPRHPDGADATG